MKWLKSFWRDLVDYVKYKPDCYIDRLCDEFERLCELGEKYERLQRYYPNILGRLNATADKKEKAKNKS